MFADLLFLSWWSFRDILAQPPPQGASFKVLEFASWVLKTQLPYDEGGHKKTSFSPVIMYRRSQLLWLIVLKLIGLQIYAAGIACPPAKPFLVCSSYLLSDRDASALNKTLAQHPCVHMSSSVGGYAQAIGLGVEGRKLALQPGSQHGAPSPGFIANAPDLKALSNLFFQVEDPFSIPEKPVLNKVAEGIQVVLLGREPFFSGKSINVKHAILFAFS